MLAALPRKYMNIEFEAKSVSYEEALGGDIIQVVLDEDPDDGATNPKARNLCFSINYEFPPRDVSFEWAHGYNFGGGKALKYSISNSEFSVWLDDGNFIKVGFSTNVSTYNKIVELLQRELGNPINA
jgi:hypothetical protein